MVNFGCIRKEKLGVNRNELTGGKTWSLKVSKTTSKPTVVTVSIVRGKGTHAMLAAWSRFWHRVFEQRDDPRTKAGDSSS